MQHDPLLSAGRAFDAGCYNAPAGVEDVAAVGSAGAGVLVWYDRSAHDAWRTVGALIVRETLMPPKILRRCSVCGRFHATFLEPAAPGSPPRYLCAACWKALYERRDPAGARPAPDAEAPPAPKGDTGDR